MRLRGASGDSSSAKSLQKDGADKPLHLSKAVKSRSTGNSTLAHRARVAKYQSRILFLGQLPFDVTKDQVSCAFFIPVRQLAHYQPNAARCWRSSKGGGCGASRSAC